MDAELTRAALDALRPVFGDVGIIAETVLQGSDRAVVARLVLITDVGARSVMVKTAKTSGYANEPPWRSCATSVFPGFRWCWARTMIRRCW